jgi:4-amino-4-deoxy-L-arabinose transferase-like glycosyltransferase
VSLLLVLFALLTVGVRYNSFTADEPAYIGGGYTLWARGEEAFAFLARRGYPPLLSGLEALLLYLSNPNVPVEQLTGWPQEYDIHFAKAFTPYMAPLERTQVIARMPTILLTLILAAVVFRWGKSLWGPKAGLLALLVLVFDPTLLGHGRLAHTDAGVTALGVIALYTVWRWTQRPSWRRALGAGVLLSLALLAKISGTIFAATAVVIALAAIIQRRRERRTWRRLAEITVAGGAMFLVFWAAYGFTWGQVRGIPLPAPDYWESLLYLDQYRCEVFAIGYRTWGQWWWYFPLAFLVKNPLPLLIGWVIGLSAFLRGPRFGLRTLVLGFFPLLYAWIAITRGMNIGYRHMLPIHPFLYLAIGGGMWLWARRGRAWRRWLLGALGAWYVIGTVSMFPYELSYFNELAGGPYGGYRYLVDSNLDWGQFDYVRDAYRQEHPEVIFDLPTAPFRPAAGRYAVSATFLQGVAVTNPDIYEWFRRRQPVGRVDYGLLLYDVPPYDLGWFAQCDQPAPPLDDAGIAAGTGYEGLRDVSFDCTQAWLYPAGIAQPGIYALHHSLVRERGFCPPFLRCASPAPYDAFVTRHLSGARLSFEQERYGQYPAFVLYEATAPLVAPSSSKTYVAPLETPPVALQVSTPISGPVLLDGPLAFVGATAYPGEDALEVETWWRVIEGPITSPFSIMAHLLTPDGNLLGVADGFGVSPLALSAGDVVVQRHRFSQHPGNTPLWLQTGVYWLGDPVEQWQVWGGESERGNNSIVVALEVQP